MRNKDERISVNMSTYIEDIFARMELGQIREFLLRGVEPLEKEDQTYGTRLENGREAIYKRLQALYPDDEDSLDETYYDLAQALGSYETVFLEIGMRAGARLIYQLLLTAESADWFRCSR